MIRLLAYTRRAALLTLTVIIPSACFAEGSHAPEEAAGAGVMKEAVDPSSMPSEMIVVPFAEAEFFPVLPDTPESPEIALLWGDPATGPSAMLMRLRRGQIPFHSHSSDYHLVVLHGTMKHWGPEEEVESAPPLGPFSYWFQPGDLPHAEACLTDHCLLHVVWTGPQDAQLVP